MTANGIGGVTVATPGAEDRPDTAGRVAALYTDGGVIGPNPSPVGGTWAYCHVNDIGARVYGTGGTITPAELGIPEVTNNVTELLAMVRGLESLPDGWAGPIYTDSLITLYRAERPRKSKFNGVPGWLRDRLAAARGRLGAITLHLLCGHPTREELAAGRGRRGYPVSIHNVWADAECNRQAAAFRKR